ncbi:quinolinate synthase NadA [Sediminicurvatus halobius]|uniref:Quinolinate synthase n=1 Tax=Sediminicurvatus halobius TaxID=2182432 RepID=A0A2U2N562_9GAMM|nr:quinolinate synthase NadA [Spiribacter halobius]PWG64119.1 quinolinate synthase [Spiribacter halobius]UEX78763.1 quinolinate synthase NadA [Spiribacter halobius]
MPSGLDATPRAPAYTPEVAARTAHLYERVKGVIPEPEWPVHAAEIDAIQRLKRERNAVVLAHNYQTPEIFHGVADIVGDSLALARQAAATEADVIVQAGVHFMAETSKLLSPEKRVLIPDPRAGCSLASSIGAEDVRRLRERYPDAPVVSYVNTSAAVKAESDICCTSGNAVQVVESLGARRVIFLPDQYLAHYVALQTDVEIISWQGQCEVHERFTGAELEAYRRQFDELAVIAHPECPPDVLAAADYVGSTAQMIRFVEERRPRRVLLVTECSMSDNVAAGVPEVEFVRPCNLCPHMKRITLPGIRRALETLAPAVEIPPALAARARRAVERMLAVV